MCISRMLHAGDHAISESLNSLCHLSAVELIVALWVKGRKCPMSLCSDSRGVCTLVMADWRQTLTFRRCKVSGDLMRGRRRERVIEDNVRKRGKECLWVFLYFTNIVIVTLTVSHPSIWAQLGQTDVTFVLINIPVILFYHWCKGCSFLPNCCIVSKCRLH